MTDTIRYYYSNATCGAGKTRWAAEHMAGTPARYIYAVDRTEEFDKRRELILTASEGQRTAPVIRSLSNKSGDVVTRDFPLQVENLSALPHVVLIVTHEALKLVDHGTIEGRGWSLIIDEDPKIWSHATFDICASKPFWEATYNLIPFMDGYSTIRPKADAPSWREICADDLTRPFASFHARLNRGPVVVNLSSWEQLQQRKQLGYFSVWDVGELAAYDRVTFLANSFDKLITYRLISALHPTISMQPIRIGRPVIWASRDVLINYFAEDHRAGSSFFGSTEAGREAVEVWAKWVRENVDQSHHFWCTNKSRAGLNLPGQRVSPKIAGSNSYRDLTQCSVLYSAKASGPENRVFAALSGGLIDADAVMRDREYEDLMQIVFRSSLRMPKDARPVMLTVYDRDQAEFLAHSFSQAGFPFNVTLNHLDYGLSHAKAKPGRRPNPASPPLTAAERQRRRRERLKAKAAA